MWYNLCPMRSISRGVVVLAAGDFPRVGSEARRILASARIVVCCDGAADAYRRQMKREPDVVVGDGDSLRGEFANVVRVPEQETNDLEKALAYCRQKGYKAPVIVGATGKREDHTLGNIFRAFAWGVEIVTDFGRFIPIEGRATLSVKKGAAISVFATDPRTRVTSTGLAWPLEGVKFRNLYCATLNRATAARVTLTASHRIYVYVEVKR